MEKIRKVIIVALLFLYSSSFAQWSQQAVNTPTTITGTFFTSVDTGYAVGHRIFKTTDGGIVWNQIYAPIYDIADIDFISNTTGYAISNGGYRLYKTMDGGSTWDSTAFSPGSYFAVDFITPDTGFIVGLGPGSVATIWRTTDEGVTWNSGGSLGANSEVTGIQMLNSSIGYACGFDFGLGNGLFFKTIDGGNTWNSQIISILPNQMNFNSVYFTDPMTGYIAGHYVESGTGANKAVIYKTTDGGLTWSSQDLSGASLNVVQFVNDSTGYIGGYGSYGSCGSSVIYKTTDSGTNWQPEPGINIYGIASMYFVDENNGYAFEKCQGSGTYGALVKYGTVNNNICFASYSVAVDSATSVFTLTIDPVTVFNTVNYFWDFGNGTTSTLATPNFSSAIDTVLNVCMTAFMATGDSCTYCHLIGIDSLGNIIRNEGFTVNVVDSDITTNITSAQKEDNYLLYPNPTSGELTIVHRADTGSAQLNIFNLLGKTILSTRITGNHKLDISDVNAGVYIIEITNDLGISRTKLYKR
ncbi:MAG: C-terminal target protein [Bacteroidetes bacterium]|jgi:photosystem II stability/assembly factor-like uncharacterized protein|nr:C-terminal target protein [Bacteroidota bacterium]